MGQTTTNKIEKVFSPVKYKKKTIEKKSNGDTLYIFQPKNLSFLQFIKILHLSDIIGMEDLPSKELKKLIISEIQIEQMDRISTHFVFHSIFEKNSLCFRSSLENSKISFKSITLNWNSSEIDNILGIIDSYDMEVTEGGIQDETIVLADLQFENFEIMEMKNNACYQYISNELQFTLLKNISKYSIKKYLVFY